MVDGGAGLPNLQADSIVTAVRERYRPHAGGPRHGGRLAPRRTPPDGTMAPWRYRRAPALHALRGLIEVQTRALDEDLPGALQEVVQQLARVLDVRAVAINLQRPAWDDFEIVAIHAPPEIIDALRGGKVPRATVERLLDPKFDVGGRLLHPGRRDRRVRARGPERRDPPRRPPRPPRPLGGGRRAPDPDPLDLTGS